MALDEALLNAAVESQFAAFRLYSWAEPTVSLGHFQPEDDPVVAARFPQLAQVRRLSGGGAILHDRELTYSLVLPAAHPLCRSPSQIYDVIHQELAKILREHGAPCSLRGSPLSGPEPFLCFSRGDVRDIVLNGQKIVGSAQRRRSGAVLQHGAILLSSSAHATEFSGLNELTGREWTEEELKEELCVRLPRCLGTPVLAADWPPAIHRAAAELMVRYARLAEPQA